MTSKLARTMAGPPAYAQPYQGLHNAPYQTTTLPNFEQPGAVAQQYMPPMAPPQARPQLPPMAQQAPPPQQSAPQMAADVPPMPPSVHIGQAPGMQAQVDPGMLQSFWDALKNPRQATLPDQMANGQYVRS